ncbi:MAG: tryptophan 7-halogenase [Cyclobacteriaceae bacterium]
MAVQHYDIAILGGGPAGAAMAIRMAQMGYRVVLCEQHATPPFHIGLSLSPGVRHWLGQLGVAQRVESAGFGPAQQSVVLWESDEPMQKHYAREQAGYHADRSILDEILLQRAQEAGAELLRPCKVSACQWQQPYWHIAGTHDGSAYSVKARFLVEATGRSRIIKSRKQAYRPATLATYSIYPYQGTAPDWSFIEAGPAGWYWGAPLSRGYLMCVFSDIPSSANGKGHKAAYRTHVEGNSLISKLPLSRPATLPVTACTATPCYDAETIAHNFIKIGDSAFTMDPLSSQGIQKAMKSAIQGAVAVHTLLAGRDPETALAYYRNMITREVQTAGKISRDFYARQGRYDSAFWASRRVGASALPAADQEITLRKDDVLHLNPDATVKKVPVLGKQYIEAEEGILLNGHEPLVYLNGYPVAALSQALHNVPVFQTLPIISQYMPGMPPAKVLQHLIYHRVLCRKPAMT